MSQKCELCGKKNKNQVSRFCSIRCRNIHNSQQQKKKGKYRNCIICGTRFYIFKSDLNRRPAKYCSTKCAGIAKLGKNNYNYKDKINAKCLNCNKRFEAYPSRIANGRSKYCSRKCRDEARRKLPSSRPRKNKTVFQYAFRFTLSCDECGTKIRRSYKSFGIYNNYFCSKDCYSKYKTKAPEEKESVIKKNCLFCGKEFWGNIYDHRKGRAKFCSMKCMGGYRSANDPKRYTSGRGGKRKDLDGLYVRSSWEANYARYLKWLKELGEIKDWEYEADTFEFKEIKKGTRFYTPDFKIINKDNSIEYHETKGYMDKRSKTKLKRMKKYYPEIKIVVIGEEEYYSIANQVRNLIPHWETY